MTRLGTPRVVIPSEHDEQSQLFAWLRAQHPKVEPLAFSVPNGAWFGKLSKLARAKVMAKLKREGFRNGVPDLFIAYPAHGKHGLFIEMKRRKGSKGSKTSADQLKWRDKLLAQGYGHAICKGCAEAQQVINDYLRGNDENLV